MNQEFTSSKYLKIRASDFDQISSENGNNLPNFKEKKIKIPELMLKNKTIKKYNLKIVKEKKQEVIVILVTFTLYI